MKRFVLAILFAATVATGLMLTPSGVRANDVSAFAHCVKANGLEYCVCHQYPDFC
jgi:hypothetical protein